MRTLAETERNTLPRGWVRQAVMGVLRWKDIPNGNNNNNNRNDIVHHKTSGTLQQQVIYLL